MGNSIAIWSQSFFFGLATILTLNYINFRWSILLKHKNEIRGKTRRSLILLIMIDGYNVQKTPKNWLPSCLIKKTQKKKNHKRFLCHYYQLRLQNKIMEMALAITVIHHAIKGIRAIFSLFLTRDHPNRNYSLEKSNC